MKDITTYFGSPTHESKPPHKDVSPNKISNEKQTEKHIDNNDANLIPEKSSSCIDPAKKRKRKSKKGKARKPSDPGVNNITELMSNSLYLLSPNNSVINSKLYNKELLLDSNISGKLSISDGKQTREIHNKSEDCSIILTGSSKVFEANNKEQQAVDQEILIIEEDSNENNSKKTAQINAFKFLMDSRNKSIGSNSPGKELDKDTVKDKPDKNKIAARKNLLSDWAEKKGGAKRKREEAEKEEIINHKLQKRAKHLKKLLNAVVDEEDSVCKEKPKVKKKLKRARKLSSDSENSSDDFIIVKKKEDKIESAIDGELSSNIVAEKSNKEDTKTETSDVETITLCKGNISNSKDLQQEASNNEMSNNTSSKCYAEDVIEDGSDSEQMVSSTMKKRGKTKSKETQKKGSKSSKRLSELLDESAQDIQLSSRKVKEGNHTLLNFFGVINKSSEMILASSIDKDKSCNSKSREKNTEGLIGHVEESIEDTDKISVIDNETEAGSVTIMTETDDTTSFHHPPDDSSKQSKRKKSKKKKNTKGKETPKIEKIVDESSQEDVFTPRRLRSWKMRIRVKLNEEEAKQGSETDKKFIADDNSHDSNSRGSDIVCLSSDGDSCDEYKPRRKLKKPVKVAPVFMKATPKPKVNPEVLEARRQFLMSGIPDSLRKNMEKQQKLEEKEYNCFPITSHVQQKCNSNFWNLPSSDLKLPEFSPINLNTVNFKHSLPLIKTKQLDVRIDHKKISDLKAVVEKIKLDNPNYPVFKVYKAISERNDTTKTRDLKKATKKTKSKKKHDKSVEIVESQPLDLDVVAQAMWTEKYKPRSSEDIIGNTEAVKKLKKWLVTWMNFSEEINSKGGRTRRNSNSSDEFVTSDSNSRDCERLPGNTMVLDGPCSSGKSTAVYAICNELGFNVIEVNASSKRTGKHLLQKVQEATQSHQVRKGDLTTFNNMVQQVEKTEAKDKRICVLLIEDIDIVFDQDDGFLTALTQLITTSKRPVILTTTDFESVFVQRFLNEYERITFLPFSARSLAVWLQIVCLVEGIFIQSSDIAELLEFNKGDVRKTLLQLQFWVQSGGEIVRDEISSLCDNETSQDLKKLDILIHRNCVRSFETPNRPIPYHLKLGTLWWNFTNILNIQTSSKQHTNKLNLHQNEISNIEEKAKINELVELYNSVCTSDVLLRKMNYIDDVEPIVKNIQCGTKDSIELREKVDEIVDIDFVREITHYLVNGQVQKYRGDEKSRLDAALPGRSERRWREKRHVCEDVFKGAISSSACLDRKSVALDYMPAMRCISRTEDERAVTNTKRGNRFRNYLRNLVSSGSDDVFKFASRILKNC